MNKVLSPRIVIDELPALENLSEEEIARIYGAGRPGFRPSFEVLETRDVMSASAMSSLGGTLVQFNLESNGHLEMTRNKVQADLGVVQGIFQGKDSTGHQLAFDLVNQQLNEFNGNSFAPVGGSATSVFNEFNGLMISSGHIQYGSYIQADVNVHTVSGTTQIDFKNVTINFGQFVTDFLGNAVTTVQKYTKSLQPLADALNKKLISVGPESLTTINLLNDVAMFAGPQYSQAAQTAQTFANAIDAINQPFSPQAIGMQITLGSFSAQVNSQGGLTTLANTVDIAAAAQTAIQNALKPYASELQSLQNAGLSITLSDAKQLLKLLTNESATLMTYTPKYTIQALTFNQRLASIPISPETATELDIDLVGGISLTAQATFGFDTSGFATGNLANGFFMQSPQLSATLQIGPAGTINEADLVGYQVAGVLTVKATMQLGGADGSSKIYLNQLNTGGVKLTVTVTPQFGLQCKTLGPQQMLGIAIQQAPAQAKQIVNAVGKYLGMAAGDVKTAFNKYLGQTDSAAATELQKLGVPTANISAVLSGGYNTSDSRLAQILNDLHVDPNHIAAALKNTFNSAASEIAVILSGLKVSLTDTFWAIASPSGANLGNVAGLNGLVGAKLLPNTGNAAADFLINKAGVSLSSAATTLEHWISSNQLVNTFFSIANGAGKGMVGGLTAIIQAGLLPSTGNAAADFLLNKAGVSLSSAATTLEQVITSNPLVNTFFSIANGAGKGMVSGLNAIVQAGLLPNTGNAAADFLLNKAGVSLSSAATTLEHWISSNQVVNTFWSIANGAGKGMVSGLNALVQAGLLPNTGNAAANFLINQAGASWSSAATTLEHWISSNQMVNTFWSIANGAGKGMGGGLTALVQAGLLPNTGNAAANFLINQAGASWSSAATTLEHWLSSNQLVNSFWSIANGANLGAANAIRALTGANMLGNGYSSIYGFLTGQMSVSSALEVLAEPGMSNPYAPGISVGPGGVTVSAPGVSTTVGNTGVTASAPGVSVSVGSTGVSAQVGGYTVSAGW